MPREATTDPRAMTGPVKITDNLQIKGSFPKKLKVVGTHNLGRPIFTLVPNRKKALTQDI